MAKKTKKTLANPQLPKLPQDLKEKLIAFLTQPGSTSQEFLYDLWSRILDDQRTLKYISSEMEECMELPTVDEQAAFLGEGVFQGVGESMTIEIEDSYGGSYRVKKHTSGDINED